MKTRRGLVLAVVLWMITLLSVMVYFIARQTHLSVRVIKAKNQYEFSDPLFRSAYLYARTVLEGDPTPETDSVNDEFFDNPTLFREGSTEDKDISFSIVYSAGKNEARYGFEFLNSRFNVNDLTESQIEKIMDETDFTEEQFAALMDWTDKDNDAHNHGAGAENDYYQDQTIPYKALNKPLSDWSSLYLIKGMTPAFAEFIQNNFTCRGDGKVNIHVAEDQTLKWMGMSESLIRKLKEYLMGPDLLLKTPDDPVFDSVSRILETLNKEGSLDNDETAELQKALPLLSVSTPAFRIRVVAGGMTKSFVLERGMNRILKSTDSADIKEEL